MSTTKGSFRPGDSKTRACLDTANGTRIKQAKAVAQIKAGELDAVEVLRSADIPLPLDRLLMAIPRFGRVRAIRVLRDASKDSKTFITGMHRLAPSYDTYEESVLTPGMRAALIAALTNTRLCAGDGCTNEPLKGGRYCSMKCMGASEGLIAA